MPNDTSGTITSANAVFTLTIPQLYAAPVQLQGYSAEKAWGSESQKTTESQMGVDGNKASGWIPAMLKQTVTLLANSKSKSVFNNIKRYQEANRDALVFQGTIVLNSTGESFNCINGTLEEIKALPDANKVLGPQDYVIEWQDIQPSLV